MNNSITIIGHVGQNPTEKSFASGKKVVNFSVAVKEYGAAQENPQTTWFEVQAWNGLGDSVLANITKGREVLVQGRLILVRYKAKENDQLTVQPAINLSGYHLCGKKPSSNSAESKIDLKANSKKSKE